ncbi:MAG: DUF3187 family protein [Nitrospiraceae bacterium]|nr:DUF3187 family protein [Nitrospiraceae bacterium]
MKARLLIIVPAVLIVFAGTAFSFGGPLRVKNQFPLSLHIDSPYLESAKAENSISVGLSHSSVYMTNGSSDWSVDLDMEVTELDVAFKKIIPGLFEVGLEVPVLSAESGFMDDFLDSYHQTFGFPDYGRSGRPSDSFLYQVRKDGSTVVSGRNGRIGIGDIRLTAKRELLTGDPAVSVRAEIELPTGDADDGHGSGGIDTGFALLADKKISETFMTYWNAGIILPGRLRAQEDIGLRTSYYGGACLEAALWRHVALLGQVTFQTSPFPKTDIGTVDRIAALLSFGARYSPGKDSIEFSLTEDPNTAGAPDVIFTITYKKML